MRNGSSRTYHTSITKSSADNPSLGSKIEFVFDRIIDLAGV